MARKEQKKNLCRHMTSYGECTLTEEPCVQGPCSREEPEEWVPVVHGWWVHLGGDEWCCSACGFVITTEGSWDKPTKKYCEDCGAKMQKVE